MVESRVACAVCGEGLATIFEIGGLKRGTCAGCGHAQRIDIPAFDYASFAMGGTARGAERLEAQAEFLAPFVTSNARVLEIGCAAGDLAAVLRSRHDLAQYDGLEMSPAREQAAEVMENVFSLSLPRLLERGRVAPQNYDLVISSHCLEHVLDIGEEVEAIVRVLSNSGTIFIEVPNRSGNALLAFDDNRAHLHFFSVASLTRLLSNHGMEVLAAQTGAQHDERYPDSLRVIARRISDRPLQKRYALSDHALMAGLDNVVVWGAGKMVDELLEHFFDPSRIAFFVDSDERKWGSSRMGVPVRPLSALSSEGVQVVVINSLEYEPAIRQQLLERFPEVRRVIAVRELLV